MTPADVIKAFEDGKQQDVLREAERAEKVRALQQEWLGIYERWKDSCKE